VAGSETRKASTTTTLRLTPEERQALVAAAEAQGLGPSTFARKAALEAAGAPVVVRRRRDVLAAAMGPLLGELARVGSNINQVARHVNRGGSPAAAELATLRSEVEQLTHAVMSLREVS